MSVADKLLQVNQVKQDIKQAIENKGVPLTNVAFTEYANKILDISGGNGGGWDISYEEYALALYYRFGKLAIFENAWQDSQDSETVLFDIPLALAAPNQEMGGMTVDLYVGTDGQLQALYDACANETIPPPITPNTRDVYYVNNVATYYWGDASGIVGFPIPLYAFGDFDVSDNVSFAIGDLTPFEMGLGLVLAKIVNVSIPNNNIVIQQGFEFGNENGIIIPDSVTSIGERAFYNWSSNNQPLVIPDSVTSIGESAFDNWSSNNQPLVIPDSVTSIGDYAFYYWLSNNQPLVIPDSVTSIGERAFYRWSANNQPLVIPNSVTSIGERAFYNWLSNNQPLVIPESVTTIAQFAFAGWSANNQPLVIPDSVTSIGERAFYNWSSNNQPLVIPDSVTSIGGRAFYNWLSVPYVEIQAITPPSLAHSNAFANQNNAPIYVPDESVDAYKTATNWGSLANRIFSINDR